MCRDLGLAKDIKHNDKTVLAKNIEDQYTLIEHPNKPLVLSLAIPKLFCVMHAMS